MKRIKVNLDKQSSTSYEICIGHNILDRIGLVISKSNLARHYIVITDSNVSSLYREELLTALKNVNLNVDLIEFPAGEISKNTDTVLTIIKKLINLGADRNSALIALGGGVTGDMTGFIASIYMRSIPYIQIPTTLMAQVDSSIGGKTGIDLPEGKNLLGAFFQPKSVFIDLQFLKTLPDEEFMNGLSEIVKYGIIDDMELFNILERETENIKSRSMDLLELMVERSCKIKKGIVEIDEMDMGVRRILNFGHTIGHAIEAESGYMIPHGNAVSIGMIASARISEKLHYLSSEDRNRIEHLIKSIDLPDHLPTSISMEGMLSKIRTDKKKKGDLVHFVLLSGYL
ncbi:MAG: 3-dehydroquinate synthase [Desulfobacteraceae bacterium 4484_190.3]|nr:MAG: 3-dehydroquinate synthase [Desulfobacteraceae bacterium 4484_190.3]